jgi:hypothetical protein
LSLSRVAQRQRRGNRFALFLEPLQVRYFRKAGKAQLQGAAAGPPAYMLAEAMIADAIITPIGTGICGLFIAPPITAWKIPSAT